MANESTTPIYTEFTRMSCGTMDTELKELGLGKEECVEHLEDGGKEDAADLGKQAFLREHELTIVQAVRKYPMAVMWSMLVSMSIIMEGYDIVLMQSLFAQPAFAKAYGQLDAATGVHNLSAPWQAALTNGVSVGTIIGAFCNGYFTHHYGYRKVMMASLVAMTAFVFIPFFAKTLPVLLLGEILCGIPWGVFATMAPAYASEVCPMALRGYLTVYVNLCWAFGQLIAAGVLEAFSEVNTQWAYRIPFGLQWMWPVPLFLIVYFAPESPWHFVRTGDLASAEKSARRLATGDQKLRAKETVAMMVHTNDLEKDFDAGTTYWDCFKGIDRRRTEIVCMAFAAQPFSGSAMGGTPTYFFIQAGLPTNISFKMTIGGLALAVLGTVISWKLMNSFGRRGIYLWGLGVLACVQITVGCISAGASNSEAGNYAQAIFELLWSFIYYLTIGPMCYAIIGETSSTRLRNKSVCLSRISYYISNIACNVANPYMLNPTALAWKGKTGFFWGGTCLLFFAWTWFRLPETKDRTFEELDVLFAQKITAKDFSKYDVDPYAEADNWLTLKRK